MTALDIVKKFYPAVTSVIDAKTNLRIHVTGEDSMKSTVKDHTECAMAVACKRTFGVDAVIISKQRAYLITGDRAVRFATPESVSREVVSFDRNAGFDVGEYELTTPPKIKKRVGKPKGKAHRTSPGYKRKFAHHTGNVRADLVSIGR